MGKDKREIPADVLADADQESGHSLWRLDLVFHEALETVIERDYEVLRRLTDDPRVVPSLCPICGAFGGFHDDEPHSVARAQIPAHLKRSSNSAVRRAQKAARTEPVQFQVLRPNGELLRRLTAGPREEDLDP